MGEQGFPGTLVTNIIYTVTETNGLIVSYHAVSDKKNADQSDKIIITLTWGGHKKRNDRKYKSKDLCR